MNWDQVTREWLSVSQQIKLKWGKFTNDDLAMISGGRESFVRLFEQRHGDDKATAEKKIDAFVAGLKMPADRANLLPWSQHCWKNIKHFVHVRPRI